MSHSSTFAPLYEALQACITRDSVRFHMPGHKGKSPFPAFRDAFALDFTETYGTGNLYTQEGPIRHAEQLAAAYYGAHDCHFLTGGSTQGVHAMLCAIGGVGGEILLDRTAHKSACAACALFALTPHFIYPSTLEPFGCSGALEISAVERAIVAHPNARALLIVSPNYHGVVQDIPALSALCHAHGKLLLVDAAHGAHFPAVGLPSPVQAGADAAVLSAHKTLPALGQSAMLLLGENVDAAALREASAMCGSSSPSYPLLASIDLARAWLETDGWRAFHAVMRQAQRLREVVAESTPFTVLMPSTTTLALDPCRLSICCATGGYNGHALAQILFEEYNIACEMADDRCVVCILTAADTALDLRRLRHALLKLGKQATSTPLTAVPPLPPAHAALSVRTAWFSPQENIPLGQANGRICARAVTPYPPGIPLLWPGEKITDAHIEFLIQRCYTKEEFLSVVRDARI